MLKNVIKEIQEKPFGYLSAVCARPGDGKRTFTIELANDLAAQGKPVCYCSITRTAKYLKNKLHTNVSVASTLQLSAMKSGTVVLVDDISSFTLKEGIGKNNKDEIKTELMRILRELAVGRGLHIIVADTFRHASNSDDMLPLSKEALEQCDIAYILYKDNITADTLWSADATMLKLKEIEI